MPRSGLPGYVGPVSANTGPGVDQSPRDQPTRDQPARDQPTSTLDAAVMRAMAHPARLALLEHLRIGGPATAAERAGVGGLSATSALYPFRRLDPAGIVAES